METPLNRTLTHALRLIAENTADTTERRVTAVRWFNRLYYDLGSWQKKFLALLNTYPDLRGTAAESDYRAFQEALERFGEEVKGFRRGFGRGGSSEFCARLEFLSARIPVDFRWLAETDRQAYFELEESLGAARSFPGSFESAARAAYEEFARIVGQVLGEYERDGEEYKRKAPPVAKVREIISRYTAESQVALDGIAASARRIGISLLTVEQYEDALRTEGSSNPNLLVIGEVTVSRDTYNVGQAGAVGPHAHAEHVTFNQPTAVLNEIDLDRLADELAEIRKAMRRDGTTLEHDVALSEVAKAEQAARDKQPRSAVQYLKAAGEWALDVATKLGTSVAAEALKQAMRS